MTYLNTSSFILYLVPYALKRQIAGREFVSTLFARSFRSLKTGNGYEPVAIEPGLARNPSVDEACS